ncbi:hypothetical protein JPSP30_22000 [Staphylococcus pseudintermedius]
MEVEATGIFTSILYCVSYICKSKFEGLNCAWNDLSQPKSKA